MPVDIALVSSTTDRKLGAKKDWATPDAVDNILLQLKIVYYTLYSLDAILCLLVVPFTYFWYEEYDEVATEEGTQTFGGKLWGAFKYTIAFIVIVLLLFLVGFFVPVATKARDEHKDLDYFKDLLTENRAYSQLVNIDDVRLTLNRWRTSADLLSRCPDTSWHDPVLSIYRTRNGVTASQPHQVRAKYLCTATRGFDFKPAEPEP